MSVTGGVTSTGYILKTTDEVLGNWKDLKVETRAVDEKALPSAAWVALNPPSLPRFDDDGREDSNPRDEHGKFS